MLANAAAIIRLSWSDGATAADRRNLERIKTAAADIAQDHKILRALLAALPAEGEAEAREYGPCPAYRDGEPHAGCDLCGGFGALPILSEADLATAPEPLPCPVCGRPPSDAVREAEERLRDDLKYVSPARVEAEHGSDVADAIRSAEALLIALDASAPAAGEREEIERLRDSIEIEREGQRSLARALAEINRLSRLDVAIALAPGDEVAR